MNQVLGIIVFLVLFTIIGCLIGNAIGERNQLEHLKYEAII